MAIYYVNRIHTEVDELFLDAVPDYRTGGVGEFMLSEYSRRQINHCAAVMVDLSKLRNVRNL